MVEKKKNIKTIMSDLGISFCDYTPVIVFGGITWMVLGYGHNTPPANSGSIENIIMIMLLTSLLGFLLLIMGLVQIKIEIRDKKWSIKE